MTSLSEVYDDAGGGARRRLYLGTGLFVAGAAMLVVGIALATTDLLAPFGVDLLGARKLAGVFAGLGVPSVFVGIFTVLPASARERAAAAIGASVAVFGVVLFWYAYPVRWTGGSPNLSLPVTVVYFVGAITTFWALFTAVVNFKTRNDPGGTVTLERTIDGKTERVEVPVSELEEAVEGADSAALGGVGVFGDVDRSAVMHDDEPDGDDATFLRGGDETTTASDGGAATAPPRPPAGREAAHAANPDRYCGNCAHFEYAPTGQGLGPYCGFHDEMMDDMEPCDRWEPNAG